MDQNDKNKTQGITKGMLIVRYSLIVTIFSSVCFPSQIHIFSTEYNKN